MTKYTVSIPANIFKAIASFAPTNDIRFYLNGVLLEVTDTAIYIVATNGRTLAVSKVANNPLDLPGGPVSASVTRLIINAQDVAQLAKLKQGNIEIQLPQAATPDATTQRTIQATMHSPKTPPMTIQCTEKLGVFPDWMRVANTYKRPATFPTFPHTIFDPRYVKQVDDAARLIKNAKKDALVSHIFPGEDSYAIACAQLDHDGNSWAYVMPIRADKVTPNTPPQWR